ncbi:MAG: hypothetical protein ABS917_07500 [Solibacillus sp.]|uniref:hypothetical protein n=1 Tax=Solibacillus sp. TaxID=1909654 RepID=UPI0033149A11
MDTKILYYNRFKSKEMPIDYINWANSMLENDTSTTSLNILASLREPLNIFEIEEYFKRALGELSMTEPSIEECAKHYIRHLLKEILNDKNNAIKLANQIYEVVREHFFNGELEIWYEISEMIDDFRYGDNPRNITHEFLISTIVHETKKQLS